MSEKNLVNKKVDSDDDEDNDDDYCPTKTHNEQSDQSDESEHNDDDDDDNNDDDTVNDQNQQTDNKNQNDLNVKPYDESKTNDLWKNFTSSTKSSSIKIDSPKTTTELPKSTIQNSKPITTNKILEFAGEKISVPVTTTTTTSTENSSLKRPASSSTTSNSVLDRLGIGKKQKLSTLEKSRLDWKTHKESESLIDDLESHRRGKDSYVEKKAFLQRSELREHDHYLFNVKKK
ncbi:unnamed protein product [Rotaria sordida]|uniref:Craniofacial development protein 1 n=1 Tax=Rotaria sordida TaxID=392033 RepID=A0A813S383_9BILA|nr:unnamed protein product [Rotaria sordida]